jgi:rhamnulokinase
MKHETVLAVDLGAESGRVMAVTFDGATLTPHEVHRFPNSPVTVRGTLHWDILRLWQDIQEGIARGQGLKPVGVGVDSWGVDFGLFDLQGHLLGNPVHYRDQRTEGMMDYVAERIPKGELFAQTGIQFVPFNSLYQLTSLVARGAPELSIAQTFLMIPDLIHYWLTGEMACEFSNATTTQLFNPIKQDWAHTVMDTLGIPKHIFPAVIPPGTRLGSFQGLEVIVPATHDTACAVVATPAIEDAFVYISSGTWSLVGTEVTTPILDNTGLAANITNEGGVGTYRLLRNVMGLWIVQQCRRAFKAQGQSFGYAELAQLAESAPPLQAPFNVNDLRFFPPGDHPALIREVTGQPLTEPGHIIRVVLESLALAYRDVIDTIGQLTGKIPSVIHIVGGGAQNTLLNQMTADATGLPVIAGPVEATVMGNAVMQLITQGHFRDVAEARRCLANASEQTHYTPHPSPAWDEAYERYQTLKRSS